MSSPDELHPVSIGTLKTTSSSKRLKNFIGHSLLRVFYGFTCCLYVVDSALIPPITQMLRHAAASANTLIEAEKRHHRATAMVNHEMENPPYILV